MTNQEEKKCRDTLDQILLVGKVTIPDAILDSLFRFIRYCLLGAMHLNRLAAGLIAPLENVNRNIEESKIRKRVVERMCLGFSPRKKRRFPMSKLRAALSKVDDTKLANELRVLETHVIIASS